MIRRKISMIISTSLIVTRIIKEEMMSRTTN